MIRLGAPGSVARVLSPVPPRPAPPAATRRFLDDLARCGFRGDIATDLVTRIEAGTDNSVYQFTPDAVVYPRDHTDVVRIAAALSAPEHAAVAIRARGGGTGTNGQSLGPGIVVDFSRHMTHIGAVDLEARRVRVEPGVVLDRLNERLRPWGLFFGPSLSPSNRATLGGMINTDASGIGSRVYGKTSQHVVSLQLVLADGTEWTTRPLPAGAAEALARRGDRVGAIHRTVLREVRAHRDEIARRWAAGGPRFPTGYDLCHVLDETHDCFDLARIVCGSEGTLALVTGAELSLEVLPGGRCLALFRYDSVDAALRHTRALVELDPVAVETVDDHVLELARGDLLYHRIAHLLEPHGGPPPRAVNLVEFAAGTRDAAISRASAAARSAPSPPPGLLGATVVENVEEAAAVWALRKKGVGLLGRLPGRRKPVAFVEDSAVPPQHLADYVAAFREILDREGVRYAMYGHADAGCLHVRPALDLTDPADEAAMLRITREVFDLVRRYGGVLWGEHGKGLRSELAREDFGERLYAAMCRIKAAFDPCNQLNPGKVAVPEGLPHAAILPVASPTRGQRDRSVPATWRAHFEAAFSCNGNGACFDYRPSQVMCPSYRARRHRVHSPKGRATALRAWLQALGAAGVSWPEPTGPSPSGRRAPWAAVARVLRTAWHRLGFGEDLAHEVYAAMDGCLACKGCATGCPVHVDVPALRSAFLGLYHERYARPLRDWLIGGLEDALPRLARYARAVNVLLRTGDALGLARVFAGMVDLPLLAPGAGRIEHAFDGVVDPEHCAPLPPDAVVVIQDAFTSFYEPRVVAAVASLLRTLGRRPYVVAYFPSGKALHVRGFGAAFTRRARAVAQTLDRLAATGAPLVGIEPAVTLCLRDEIPAAAGRPVPRVALLEEFLAALPDEAWERYARLMGGAHDGSVCVLLHCNEQALVAPAGSLWRRVFERAGIHAETPAVGCCGMSGAWGHEAHHRAESLRIFEASWREVVGAWPARVCVATGHSCRQQVHRATGIRLAHPAELLVGSLPPGVD